MDLRWLNDFLALAETENFSRAAERRHITQPAFSRRIQSLEEWMGAPLFRRERHKAALTPAGKAILAETKVLTRALYHLRHTVRAFGRNKTSTLYFAATHSLSLGFFPSWIKEYAQPTNGYAINLISDTMTACEEALLQGRVQFLLCHESSILPSRFAAKGYDFLVVGKDVLAPYVAVDSAGSPLWTLAQNACGHVPWLRYSPESGFHRMMESHAAILEQTASVPASFTTRFATVLLSVACDGKGIAWLPASLTASAVTEGRLIRAGGPEWEIPLEVRLFRAEEDVSESTMVLWEAVSLASKTPRP
jgi:Transcriptional regulator